MAVSEEVFCVGKRAFSSHSEALKAASKTSRIKGNRYRPYKCAKCGKYHYGQTDRPLSKDRRPTVPDEGFDYE